MRTNKNSKAIVYFSNEGSYTTASINSKYADCGGESARVLAQMLRVCNINALYLLRNNVMFAKNLAFTHKLRVFNALCLQVLCVA